MLKACIDVGSNSILLAVESKDKGNSWSQIFEDSEVTALGEDVKQTQLLREDRMVATLKTIKRFVDKATSLGADTTIIGATMAVRIAKNQAEFLARAEHQGTSIRVLSGDVEAQLGFEAVAYDPLFADQQKITIIDPGGQSTELTTATRTELAWKVEFRRSFPIGTLALRGGPCQNERLDGPHYLTAAIELDDLIGLTYLPRQAGVAVVLGATGTNLVSILHQYNDWKPELVHGACLRVEEISNLGSWLAKMSDEERSKVPGIEPGRERTIHLGALILERFLFAIREIECQVSVRGWRHALIERGLPDLK